MWPWATNASKPWGWVPVFLSVELSFFFAIVRASVSQC